MTKDRDQYEWPDAASDLALNSTLTLWEASEVTAALEMTGIHPYDAFPHLVALFKDWTEPRGRSALKATAEAIAALIHCGGANHD